MFTIENHTYARAGTPNRVVLYIGADVHMTLWAGREGLAAEIAALEPGQSLELPRIPWIGARRDPIIVRRAERA